MDAGRPGAVVLWGSRREEIYKWINDRIPFPCVLLNDLEKYDGPGRMIFGVFCPADSQELENLYREAGRDFLSSAVPSAAILTFAPDAGIGFPILLHRSDFTLELLRRMACSAGMHADSAASLNCILWERTGSLLPFFIHNMNNILARIMGNIELAEFHSGRTDKASKKLSIALEATDELRSFLERLSVYSMPDDDESEWTSGNETDVLELTRMSSGTSVKFTYEEKGGMPGKIPVRKNLMNLLTGLIAAAATISVNGCGSIEMSVSPQEEAVEFRLNWNSSSKSSGLCPNSMDSAADLLNRAALIAVTAKLTFRLGAWNSEGGSISLLVPIDKEDI
ncbi:MAG: hypothetical protein KAR44_00090 [Candidatus Aegiribacteria sp.]|nr:hypothetical protein [Candidatus Aegiribacteria sp.]